MTSTQRPVADNGAKVRFDGAMLFGLIRAVLGFAAACLVAGVTQVAFATVMPNLASVFSSGWIERIGPTVALILYATALSAVFAAPFALVAIALGRWQRFSGWIYYALAGVGIGLGGFLVLQAGEVRGQPTIVNTYALMAYVTAGLLAGVVYWLLAGRKV